MEIVSRGEELKYCLLAKLRELEEASQVMAEQAKENSSLKLEVTKLQELKEEAEMKCAAFNSLVAELEKRNADIEACYVQASSDVASLQKDKEDGLKREKDLEQQVADLTHQLASAKAEAAADFKKSEFFEENMLLLQGSVMQMGQTKAINICSEICPQLNKEDSRLADLYNPDAEADFESRFQKFTEGSDLRDEE